MTETKITLFPDQRERFVRPISNAFASGVQSVLGVLPTGGGKTVCFSYITLQAALRAGKSVGIMAPREEIIGQISRTLDRFNISHGIIAPGFYYDPLARVQVCSVPTMGRRIERLQKNPFDLCVLDEAHHCAVGSAYHAVAMVHLQAGSKVLGVTATPQRLSGEPLAATFSEIVVGPSTAELIALGRLSDYRYFEPEKIDLTGLRKSAGDFIRREAAERVDKPKITGNVVNQYRLRMNGKRALVFCVSVAHAEHVAAQFEASGIKARAIDGNTERKHGKGTRRAFLEDFESGSYPVLTSADLISEGFDVPAVEGAFLLRPTASLALYLQQVGRALRASPGKSHAIICDHVGSRLTHGLPDDERLWSLDGKSAGGSSAASAMSARVCPSCFGVYRAGILCPYCGQESPVQGRQIEEVEGELSEVDKEFVRRQQRMEVGMAKTLEEVCAVAISRGYKAGWVVNLFGARKEKKPDIGAVITTMSKIRAAKKLEGVSA